MDASFERGHQPSMRLAFSLVACHVQHVLTAGDGFRPARVVFEIGGDEGQAMARVGAAFLQHGAHVGLALQAAYRGTHLMASGQELQDGMAANEARSAGNQNCAPRLLLIVQC